MIPNSIPQTMGNLLDKNKLMIVSHGYPFKHLYIFFQSKDGEKKYSFNYLFILLTWQFELDTLIGTNACLEN